MTDLQWFKPAKCDSASCVEVSVDIAVDGGKMVLVRDGKQGMESPTLAFTTDEWTTFIASAKVGFYDLPIR